MTNQFIRDIALNLNGHIYLASPLIIHHHGIDMGGDWMNHHEVVLDTSARTVGMESPDGASYVTLHLDHHQIPTGFMHSMEVEPLEEIPMVSDYPDVFPEELPGLPPERAVEFSIELLPGTALIFRRPYKMPPNDLAEMKV